jgi:hypothetical protein
VPIKTTDMMIYSWGLKINFGIKRKNKTVPMMGKFIG